MGIDAYGLLSDHSSYTGLAGALCHLGLFSLPAARPFVVLLGAIPQASYLLGMSTLGGGDGTSSHLSVQTCRARQAMLTGEEMLASEKAEGLGTACNRTATLHGVPSHPRAMSPILRAMLGHRVGSN